LRSRQRGFGTLLIYGLLALAIIAGLATIGYAVRKAGYDAARLECEQAAAAQREREAAQAAKAAQALEEANNARRIVYRKIVREVDKIVVEYRDKPCLDDRGLSVANRAIRGESAPATESDRPLPKPSAAVGWISGDRAALDYGDSPNLSGVLAEAPRAGGSDSLAE